MYYSKTAFYLFIYLILWDSEMQSLQNEIIQQGDQLDLSTRTEANIE